MSSATNSKPGVLVDTQWVADHLSDPNVRLIEVDVDTSAYDTGHTPNTIGWNWQTQLQQHPSRDIPTKAEWEELLSSAGISNDTHVVLFGDNNNWFAAFAYWIFKLYGHENVSLMDGGRKKWLDEKRETTTESPTPQRTSYKAKDANPALRAFRDDVQTAIDNPAQGMVDVRSPGEFSGQLLAPENLPQEGAQRGGHVPSARNIPWSTAAAADGTYKSPDELRKIYGDKGLTPDKEIIAYCRIGERSAHTWFALHEILGYPNVRNYDGSWTEWGSLIGAPIATGNDE
jgi:thiosulfate/3-mercaptopyruvate sulfurtransferase